MPLDPFSWAIIGFVVGALTATFWDEIAEWANRVLQAILDAIDLTVNVTSDAVVYLVKQGSRIYKTIEVYSRNIYNNLNQRHERREEISQHQIPDDINDQLNKKQKLKIAQKQT